MPSSPDDFLQVLDRAATRPVFEAPPIPTDVPGPCIVISHGALNFVLMVDAVEFDDEQGHNVRLSVEVSSYVLGHLAEMRVMDAGFCAPRA